MRTAVLIAPVALVGCSGPLSSLEPGGSVASEIAWVWWVMLAGAVALTFMMAVLIVMAFGAPRDTGARVWTHGMGLAFSLAVLSVTLGAGLWVGERILPRDDGAVEVRAHAFQWGWRFTHTGSNGDPVETEGLLHIPAGSPVDVLVTSEDVIHSFWVPRLAGKLDAIPGRTNRARISADTPGTYAGLCAEFCGLGHARMRFDVQAHDTWPPDLTDESEAP